MQRVSQGINQQCLFPICQESQVDAQIFFYEVICLLQQVVFKLQPLHMRVRKLKRYASRIASRGAPNQND